MTLSSESTSDQQAKAATKSGKKGRRIHSGSLRPVEGVQKRTKAGPSAEEQQRLVELFSSRWQTVAELNAIEEGAGVQYKRGKFSNAEARIIDGVVTKYIADHGMTFEGFREAFFDRRGHNRLHDLFVEAAQRLPGRPVIHVYHYMRRQYHPGNWRGRWNAEEDEQLKRLFAIHGPKWEVIGEQLGRFHTNCKDRYRQIRQQFNSGRWSEDEVDRLRQGILAWRAEQPEDCAVWAWIAAKVGTRSWLQCVEKYTGSLEVQMRRGPGELGDEPQVPQWTDQEDLSLIHRIYDLVVEDESEIVWSQLLDSGWGHWNAASLARRWKVLRKRVFRERYLDMDTILETLMQSIKSSPEYAAPKEDAELAQDGRT